MGVIVKNKLVVGTNEDYEYNEYLKSVAAERPLLVNSVDNIVEDNEKASIPEPVKLVENETVNHSNHNHGIFLINKRDQLSKRSQYLNDLLTFENK